MLDPLLMTELGQVVRQAALKKIDKLIAEQEVKILAMANAAGLDNQL